MNNIFKLNSTNSLWFLTKYTRGPRTKKIKFFLFERRKQKKWLYLNNRRTHWLNPFPPSLRLSYMDTCYMYEYSQRWSVSVFLFLLTVERLVVGFYGMVGIRHPHTLEPTPETNNNSNLNPRQILNFSQNPDKIWLFKSAYLRKTGQKTLDFWWQKVAIFLGPSD